MGGSYMYVEGNVMLAAVVVIAALVYVVGQHVLMVRMNREMDMMGDAIEKLVKGELEGRIDPDGEVQLRLTRGGNDGM